MIVEQNGYQGSSMIGRADDEIHIHDDRLTVFLFLGVAPLPTSAMGELQIMVLLHSSLDNLHGAI